MSPSITSTTQLSTFSLISAAIQANSTLAAKFNDSNIYDHKPLHKARQFKGFPYIYVRTAQTDNTEFTVLNHSLTNKDFTARMYLYMEYKARDNFKTYAEAIINAIESYESTFDSSGYYNTRIELTDVDDEAFEDSDNLVIGLFTITWDGSVDR